MSARQWLSPLAGVALVVGVWALVAHLGALPSFLFPGPATSIHKVGTLFEQGSMQRAIARSLLRLGKGFGLSILIGLPLGIAMARLRLFRDSLRPVVVGLQALPSICWFPLALLWFGLSESAIVFVVTMGSVLALAISTEDAVSGIDPQTHRVARTFGLRGPRLLLGVVLPAALPGIVTGLKLSWSFAWHALLAAELLYASGGLGMLLAMGRELMDPAQVLAVILVIVAVGLVVDRLLFRTAESAIQRRWGYLATT